MLTHTAASCASAELVARCGMQGIELVVIHQTDPTCVRRNWIRRRNHYGVLGTTVRQPVAQGAQVDAVLKSDNAASVGRLRGPMSPACGAAGSNATARPGSHECGRSTLILDVRDWARVAANVVAPGSSWTWFGETDSGDAWYARVGEPGRRPVERWTCARISTLRTCSSGLGLSPSTSPRTRHAHGTRTGRLGRVLQGAEARPALPKPDFPPDRKLLHSPSRRPTAGTASGWTDPTCALMGLGAPARGNFNLPIQVGHGQPDRRPLVRFVHGGHVRSGPVDIGIDMGVKTLDRRCGTREKTALSTAGNRPWRPGPEGHCSSSVEGERPALGSPPPLRAKLERELSPCLPGYARTPSQAPTRQTRRL